MLRAACLVTVAFCLAEPSAAQIELRPAATGTGIISGRVVDVRSGIPITGAYVNLSEAQAPVGRRYRYDTTKADAGGRFTFGNLPVGQFDIRAGATGYLEGAAGRRRPRGWNVPIKLTDGQEFTNLTVELTRPARIRGQVRDEYGRPVVGITVQAWRRDGSQYIEAPYRRVFDAMTNRDGVYDLWDLTPGDYYVVLPVSHHTWRVPLKPVDSCAPPPPPPPPGTVPKPPALVEPPRVPGSLQVILPRGYAKPVETTSATARTYATTFYPGETNPALASAITVDSGVITNLDFRLETLPATTVRGRLTRPSGKAIGPGTAVTLRRTGVEALSADRAPDATAFVDENHRFMFLDVPTGSYTLEVVLAIFAGHCDVGPGHLASDVPTRIPLDVPEAGIDDLVVPVAEGLEIEGQVIFRGSGRRPRSVNVWAGQADGSTEGSSTEGDTFTISGVTPGQWTLGASAEGWFVESITLDGHDLTAEPFTVDSTNRSGVVVTMTDAPSSVTGKVFDSTGRVVEDATVVAFPANRRLWANARPQMMRFPIARALGGSYEFGSIVAGDYVFAAVDERRMDEWPSAAFLERIQAGAPRVRIETRKSVTMALTLTPSK